MTPGDRLDHLCDEINACVEDGSLYVVQPGSRGSVWIQLYNPSGFLILSQQFANPDTAERVLWRLLELYQRPCKPFLSRLLDHLKEAL